MWHDNETTVDYVNFRLVARVCADLVQSAGGEPISIGISGGWGVGKSSLVRMIEAELSKANATKMRPSARYVVVTFNPWLYQGFEDARTALLQTVGDAVLKEAKDNTDLIDKAKDLVKRINVLRLAQLGGEVAATLITGVPVGLLGKTFDLGSSAFQRMSGADAIAVAKSIPEATKGLLNDAEPVSLPKEIQGFRDDLEDLLEKLGVTLVVFVDDLDRCLPKTAIATLEAIRLLLFLRRSAFVVAADDVFIRGAVRVHFAGTGLTDEVATNYFDKLIQVPLRVPRLGPNETKAYTALLFLERERKEGKLDADRFEVAQTMVEARLRETWKGKEVDLAFLESLVPQGDNHLLSLMGLAERLAPLLFTASAVQSNPRLVKRFLNTVYLRLALARPQGIDVDVQVLAKWHLLERCDEALANSIAKEVSAQSDGRVEMLREAEKLAKQPDAKLPDAFGDKPFTKEWLQLAPALGEVDLRPLLHLSRDSTVRDFGADDLTVEGRLVMEALIAARTSSTQLSDQIRAVGETQAGLAMARAWEARRANRDWNKADEVLMLVEVCNVFASAGPRAAALLTQAHCASLGPSLVHRLAQCAWAKDVITKWATDAQTPTAVKKAIEAAGKDK
jgi:predicted KAP-like P-loop ATPase